MIARQYRDIRQSSSEALMFTRFITFALLALAAAASGPAAAQPVRDPGELVILLSELVGRDGATPFYSGDITWTNQEGDGTESVSARVTNGRVACVGTYQDPNGARTINGPGLLEMSLGQGDNDRYSFRVACPNAIGSPVEPADFRHSYDSYEQPGGTVELINNQKAKLPRELKGSRSEAYDGGGSVGMTWRLCTRACPPSAPPAPP
jgi:hypothetical protein